MATPPVESLPAGVDARNAERLARLEDRYRHELLGEDERCELRDRILKLRRDADTLDAQHYCLERPE